MVTQMVLRKVTVSLVRRFPHLEREIRQQAEIDSTFRQLAEDYELLIRSLPEERLKAKSDRDELIELKSSLEFEALVRLSRKKNS